ncbi:MAG: U32 family peptidase [Clostridia bacterium]|nr:U32 family peptidase [Clostridia bacterium]
MTKAELLAPAGDEQSFYSAINNGADAIYLGLPSFNARIKAQNFTEENLNKFVRIAHLHGVKIYITVNTLVKDNECEDFLALISSALQSGVDAFIVQDLGMATLIKKVFPTAVLHASTQMGVHNLFGAKALEKLGFSRVVLSRETKLSDIIEIKNNTNLEIEYFVQGALCVCFSGNCYMSALKNNSSGNRGLCKQLCRLPYFTDGKKGHFLSPNDLCLINSLKILSDAGVTSYKIEGRLKRASYVAQSVKAFRTAIDNELTNTQISELKSELKSVFSRGEFNESAYLYDNDNIIDIKNNNHTGKKIGVIIAKEKFKDLYRYKIKSSEEIAFGDGLKTFGKTENSFGVGNTESANGVYTVYTKNAQIEVGDTVNKILDNKREQLLLNAKKLIPLSVKITAKKEEPLSLKITSKNQSVTVLGDICETAKNSPLTENDLKKRMKFGDTVFEMVDFHATVDGVFIPNSKINELRRRAVEQLENKILDENKSEFIKSLDGKNLPTKEEIKAVLTPLKTNFENLFSTAVIVNETVDLSMPITTKTIILSPTIYSKETIENFLNKISSKGKDYKIYLNLPIIATGKEVAVLDDIIYSFNNLGIVANNYYAFKYLGVRPILAGIGLNAYNSYTVKALKDLGFNGVISSIENHTPHTYKYAGNPPLMTMVHCPFKVKTGSNCNNCQAQKDLTYLDERGNKYFIRRYKIINCYFELLSKNNLNLGIDDESAFNYSQKIYDLR